MVIGQPDNECSRQPPDRNGHLTRPLLFAAETTEAPVLPTFTGAFIPFNDSIVLRSHTAGHSHSDAKLDGPRSMRAIKQPASAFRT